MPILIFSHSVSQAGSGNLTFQSDVLFTAPTLEASPALCGISVGTHLRVNAQSAIWSLFIDRS